MRTVREWVTRIPLFDIVLAAALAVVTLVQTADTPSDRLALRMALSAVAPVALALRRVHPALSVGLVALGMSLEALATESPDEIGVLLSVLVSAFTIAAEAGRRAGSTFLAGPAKLLHAGLEDARERTGVPLGGRDALVERVQFRTSPEFTFEGVGCRLRGADRKPLSKNDGP